MTFKEVNDEVKLAPLLLIRDGDNMLYGDRRAIRNVAIA